MPDIDAILLDTRAIGADWTIVGYRQSGDTEDWQDPVVQVRYGDTPEHRLLADSQADPPTVILTGDPSRGVPAMDLDAGILAIHVPREVTTTIDTRYLCRGCVFIELWGFAESLGGRQLIVRFQVPVSNRVTVVEAP